MLVAGSVRSLAHADDMWMPYGASVVSAMFQTIAQIYGLGSEKGHRGDE